MEKVLALSVKLHPEAEREKEVHIDPTVQEGHYLSYRYQATEEGH
jgi:hypothetical protein